MLSVQAQSWLTDSKGCKFYDPYTRPSDKVSVLWNGKCDKGLMEGTGMLSKYVDGKLFVTFYGTLSKGKYTSQVTWMFESGNAYKGGFDPVKGVMSGNGKYTFYNGEYYEGQWKNDVRQGQGLYHYANGAQFEGQWKNDEMSGQGKFTLADKSFYYGVWERDILIASSRQNEPGKFVADDSSQRYTIDPAIKNKILNVTQKAKAPVSGFFRMTMYRGNEQVIAQDSIATPFRIINQESRSNKKIILALAGAFNGMGFQLNMFDQKYQAFFYVKAEAPIFKLHASDTTYSPYLYVPCKHKKLVVAQHPEYSSTETMHGMLELSSIEFYERSDDGNDQKYRAELKAYFSYKEPEE